MGNIFKSIAKGIGGALSGAAKSIPIVGQAVDGLVGSLSSASDARASLRAQNQLLQKQQQFAHDEAELNRQFQREMFDTTNAYNSPKAQVARMVEAGLNPALMYGSGAGSIAAQSPSGSMASAPSAPTPQGLSDLSLRAAEIARINAETSLIKSQTEKTSAETTSQLTYNEFQSDILDNLVQKGNVEISLGLANVDLTQANTRIAFEKIKEVTKNVETLDAQIDYLRSQGKLNDSERFLNEIERMFRAPLLKLHLSELTQRIKESDARIDVSYKQVEQAFKNYLLQKAGLDWQKDENNPLNGLLSAQGDITKLDFGIFNSDVGGMKFREWMYCADMINDFVGSIAEGLGAFFGAKNAVKGPVKIKGFGR